MTTASSPVHLLKVQADRIAKALKALAYGEVVPGLAVTMTADSTTFGIVMDDGFLKITIPWAKIRSTEEPALSDWIVRKMQRKEDDV